MKSSNRFIFLDIAIGYTDLLFILFGTLSFFMFMTHYPSALFFTYMMDLLKAAGVITAVMLLITIVKSLKGLNLRYDFYENCIDQYNRRTKSTNKFQSGMQFNHISIYKNKIYTAVEINQLTRNEPISCFKIYVPHRKEKELLEEVYKSGGFTNDIEEYAIENQKSNSHKNYKFGGLFVSVAITAIVAFLPAYGHFKFIWFSAFLFLAIAVPLVLSEMKSFTSQDVICTSITDHGIKIQKGHETNCLLYAAVNMVNRMEGSDTDDILVHRSSWKSGKQYARKEILLEGIPKTEANRICEFLEKKSIS